MLTPFSFVNKRVSLANEDFGHLKILQQQKSTKRINAVVQNSLILVDFCLIKGKNDLQKLTYRLMHVQLVTR